MSFTQNGFPIYPGAYIINGARNWNTPCVPIYSSILNYAAISNYLSNGDDWYLVLPKFKLTVFFDGNQGGTSYDLDNNSGTKIKLYYLEPTANPNKQNQGDSCKLYYNGTEITEKYNTATITSNTPTNITV